MADLTKGRSTPYKCKLTGLFPFRWLVMKMHLILLLLVSGLAENFKLVS